MKLKFLSKFLLGMFLVCGVMFFAACSDDDNGGGGIDAGKTGEISGVYEASANVEGGFIKITLTIRSDGTGDLVYVFNGEKVQTDDFTWIREGNIIFAEFNEKYTEELIFDGADTIAILVDEKDKEEYGDVDTFFRRVGK